MPRALTLFRLSLLAAAVAVTPLRASSQNAQPARAPTDPVVTAADQGRIIGSEKATVWVLIVSDFQCPFCRQWHTESMEALKKQYAASGRVRVAFMNNPLSMHPNARPMAVAAMCASAQGKFWQYADLLFGSQAKWKDLKDPRPQIDALAKTAGLDAAKFGACLGSPAIAALVDADQNRMVRAGATSTPTFFIGRNKLEGVQPMAVLKQVIDAELTSMPRPR